MAEHQSDRWERKLDLLLARTGIIVIEVTNMALTLASVLAAVNDGTNAVSAKVDSANAALATQGGQLVTISTELATVAQEVIDLRNQLANVVTPDQLAALDALGTKLQATAGAVDTVNTGIAATSAGLADESAKLQAIAADPNATTITAVVPSNVR